MKVDKMVNEYPDFLKWFEGKMPFEKLPGFTSPEFVKDNGVLIIYTVGVV